MSTDPLKVGMIGLGAIGGGLATALVNAGRPPTAFDVRPHAAAAIDGIDVVSSPAGVAEASDVVFVAVLDAQQVGEVLLGPSGVAAGIIASGKTGVIVVVLSTIAVDVVRSLAAEVSASGVRLVDAGVSGPQGAAAAGQLVFFAGGDDDDVAIVQEALRGCAKSVVRAGPLGSGLAAKIARNLVTYGTWRAVHEAGALADAAGVDLRMWLDAIAESDPDGTMQLLLARGALAAVADDPARVASMERMALLIDKDLGAAIDLAASAGLDAPIAELTRRSARQMVGLDEPVAGVPETTGDQQ